MYCPHKCHHTVSISQLNSRVNKTINGCYSHLHQKITTHITPCSYVVSHWCVQNDVWVLHYIIFLSKDILANPFLSTKCCIYCFSSSFILCCAWECEKHLFQNALKMHFRKTTWPIASSLSGQSALNQNIFIIIWSLLSPKLTCKTLTLLLSL